MDLRGKVVVITGGSSGLGRETAVRFARRGGFVIVAARRGADLEETVRLCRRAGGGGRAVVADVTDPASVQQLCDGIIEGEGRIDVWVNNAGVTLFAPLEESSLEAHRSVIEVNLMGAIAAARVVIPVFVHQGYGTLINVGSVLSWVGQPFVPSYVASKFGLRGMTEALHARFVDAPHIHICGIYPFSIDTPHFESGGNVMPYQSRAIPPVQSPEKVANAIVRLAKRPRPRVYVPRVVVAGIVASWLFPRTTHKLVLHALHKWHFDERVAPRTEGNLFSAPAPGTAQTHGHRRPRVGRLRFGGWVARDFVTSELKAVQQRLYRRPSPPSSG